MGWPDAFHSPAAHPVHASEAWQPAARFSHPSGQWVVLKQREQPVDFGGARHSGHQGSRHIAGHAAVLHRQGRQRLRRSLYRRLPRVDEGSGHIGLRGHLHTQGTEQLYRLVL